MTAYIIISKKEFDSSLTIIKHKIKEEISKSSILLNIRPNYNDDPNEH
jgi:hypothetical protein